MGDKIRPTLDVDTLIASIKSRAKDFMEDVEAEIIGPEEGAKLLASDVRDMIEGGD